MEYRTTTGFDVHAFNEITPCDETLSHEPLSQGETITSFPQAKVILGGIKIPYQQSLKGHSDADVVLHCICDALLGLMACGDIGDFFPDTDKEWENRNSEYFVKTILEKIFTQKIILTFCDVTIIAQEPKVTKFKLKIKENIARMLMLSCDRVSIKATTTEHLGFIGRKEAIAAFCTMTAKIT